MSDPGNAVTQAEAGVRLEGPEVSADAKKAALAVAAGTLTADEAVAMRIEAQLRQ